MRMRLLGPKRGITDQVENVDTPRDFTAPNAMLNIVPNAGKDGRDNLGSRDGMTKVFRTQIGIQPVRLMGVIGRSITFVQSWNQQPALTGDNAAGGSVPVARPVTYCCCEIGYDGSILKTYVDPSGTYATSSAAGCCADLMPELQTWRTNGPVLARAAFFCNVTKTYGFGTRKIVRVHIIENGVITKSYECEDADPGDAVTVAADDIVGTSCEFVGPYLIVTAGKYVYFFNATLGTSDALAGGTGYLQRSALAGWSWLCHNARGFYIRAREQVVSNNGATVQYRFNSARPVGCVAVCYRGSPTISGAVSASGNSEGSYIRSGVATFILAEWPTTPGADWYEPDGPVDVAAQQGTSNLLEALEKVQNHNEDQPDFRIAEWIDTKGRMPLDIAWSVRYGKSDASLPFDNSQNVRAAIVCANDGYSSSNEAPNGARGYFNVLRTNTTLVDLNNTGATYETLDVQSRKDNWLASGNYNDLAFLANGSLSPDNGVGPEISTTCVAIPPPSPNSPFSAADSLILAGSFADGASVRSLGDGGSLSNWSKNLGTHIGVRGMSVGTLRYGALSGSYNNSDIAAASGIVQAVAVGRRNTAWVGSGGANACVWLIDPVFGDIRAQVDLGVNARQCAIMGNGRALVAHEFKP
jgi:hypothetical protein